MNRVSCDRVLMIGTHPSTMGGIATVVRGYREDGLFERIDVCYVATHRDGSALQKARLALGALCRATLLMVRTRPLVHVHLSARASFWRKSLFCLAARLTRRPYLLHMHGSEFMTFFDEECGPLGKALVRNIFAHASLLIALSPQWRDDLARICATTPVEVLPNAVPIPDETVPYAAQSPQRVLFLGRLGNRKGTFDLLRAFAAAAAHRPNITLTCAGDGAIAEALALAAELGVSPRVSCPGWLDPAAGAAQLNGATLFALPSYAEGLPMALLEAMARGLPVITTPIGGIPEVVQHQKNGYLVPPGDTAALSRALGELLDSADLRQRLGIAARRTIVEGFSLRAATERLERLYAAFGIRRHAA